MLSQLYKFFRSTKLAVVLMILIAIVASIGTFIPQNQSPEYYTSRYGNLGQFFLWLNFDNFYSSPTFTFLLMLLFVNTLVCTLARIKKVWKETFYFDYTKAGGNYTGKFAGTLKVPIEEFEKFLKGKGFIVRKSDNKIVAKKNMWSRIGPDIVHIGLLLIILSGIIVGLTTKVNQIFLSEGQSFNVEGTEITLEKFIFERYPDGSPKDWISVLNFEKLGEKQTFNVEVNRPLSIGNTKIYQASYRNVWNVSLRIKKGDEIIATYEGPAGSSFSFEGYEVITSPFFPDFKVDSQGRVFSATDQPNNPAIYLEYYLGPTFAAREWVFRDFKHPISPPTFPYNAELVSYEGPYYETGLNIIRSKGNNLVLVALSMMGFGLLVALYGRFIQVYTKVDGKTVYYRIVPHRNALEEAEKLMKEIQSK
ncbi:cytochrome c biogenesis protein ResB [Kosmotoga pacifica]|uniref:ResB-like domain-containing protein n=1 Tax=Kosmotoga pacifica TaxID=1330330 RepID=A0A0G2Z7R4_9BACT|nr:cytochrome c biogenesis protein ResB [Kosmotoga pacifica]AKI97640.1 hypothetical protein IX53_07225 [Kosmotoga pacifica]